MTASIHQRTWPAALAVAIAATSLSACIGSSMDDLHAYIAEVKARPPQDIKPLKKIVHIESFIYNDRGRRDPFDPGMGIEEEKTEAISDTGPGLRPDPLRRKEELEQFPLDTLRMVGTLNQNQQTWALVKSQDTTIHRVQPGNYMGQNHGQITQVSEDKVELTEIVPDGRGSYQERQASISLASDDKGGGKK